MITKEPPVHPSLVDRLIDYVFNMIMSRELMPGEKITEDQLAAGFGVSRTPVREAVVRMAELGMVVVRPRCGLEVVTIEEDDLLQVVEFCCVS